jgi:RES domain
MPIWQTEHWIESSVHQAQGVYWRAVEAQHVVATMRLVDSLAEQDLLEQILEASKPALPQGDETLHYLLTTPFRYAAPQASRFRRANAPGIWYGADSTKTACAEVGYWRWKFLMDSAGLREGELITEHTLFQAKVNGQCIDLKAPPWKALKTTWLHGTDYSACHELADAARANPLPVQWIRYGSARNLGGTCAAVFDANALKLPVPTRQETWVCKVTAKQLMFTREGFGYSFPANLLTSRQT